jgi:hypothetical protein
MTHQSFHSIEALINHRQLSGRMTGYPNKMASLKVEKFVTKSFDKP